MLALFMAGGNAMAASVVINDTDPLASQNYVDTSLNALSGTVDTKLDGKQDSLQGSESISMTDGVLAIVPGTVDATNDTKAVTGAVVRAAIDAATSGIATSGAMDALSTRVKTIEDDYATGTEFDAVADRVTQNETDISNLKIDVQTALTVDDALSETSTAPVQNKVVTAALNAKQDTLSDTNRLNGAFIKDASVATGALEDGAVTGDKMADGSVTTDKMDDGSVTTGKMAAPADCPDCVLLFTANGGMQWQPVIRSVN